MMSEIQSALSGLQAFTKKMENNANNIANVNTVGFKKDRVVLSAQFPQGVNAAVEQVDTPGPVVGEMTSQGLAMVEQSNVDLVEEIPDMMLNKFGYTANLTVLKTADQMAQSLLDIKA